MELSVNGNLCCLAIGQIEQIKDCLEETLLETNGIDFILAKGMWPSLWCQNRSVLLILEIELQWGAKGKGVTGLSAEVETLQD